MMMSRCAPRRFHHVAIPLLATSAWWSYSTLSAVMNDGEKKLSPVRLARRLPARLRPGRLYRQKRGVGVTIGPCHALRSYFFGRGTGGFGDGSLTPARVSPMRT